MEWTVALEIFGLIGGIATVMALLIVPTIWLGSKIDAVSSELNQKIDLFRKEVDQDMSEFRKEMKYFHGRLISIETRKNFEDYKNKKSNTNHYT